MEEGKQSISLCELSNLNSLQAYITCTELHFQANLTVQQAANDLVKTPPLKRDIESFMVPCAD